VGNTTNGVHVNNSIELIFVFVLPRLSRSRNNKSRTFSRRRVGRSNANGAPAAPQPKRRALKAELEVTNPFINAI
jgi:hypothetical protein